MKRKNIAEFPLWNRHSFGKSFIVKMVSVCVFVCVAVFSHLASHSRTALAFLFFFAAFLSLFLFLFFRFVKCYIISSLLCDRVSERTSDYTRTHSSTAVYMCVCDDQNRSANKRNSTTTKALAITVKKALSAQIQMYLTLNGFFFLLQNRLTDVCRHSSLSFSLRPGSQHNILYKYAAQLFFNWNPTTAKEKIKIHNDTTTSQLVILFAHLFIFCSGTCTYTSHHHFNM